MDVAISKQKKMYYLIRKVKLAHGVTKGEDGYCGQKGDHGQKDCVALEGNPARIQYALSCSDQWSYVKQWLSLKRKRKQEPEKEN
jgi:hypothetical protein